jgi:Ca2+/Na+ antiporter
MAWFSQWKVGLVNTIVARIEQLPRPRRRLVVLTGLLGYPLSVLVLVALKRADLNRWLILSIFLTLIALTVVAVLVGYGYGRGRIDGHHAHVDERDRALRQQAYALSHQVLAAILIAVVAAVEVYLTAGNTIELDANTFLPAAMWVIVYIPALPSLMLAWIEPNAVADA